MTGIRNRTGERGRLGNQIPRDRVIIPGIDIVSSAGAVPGDKLPPIIIFNRRYAGDNLSIRYAGFPDNFGISVPGGIVFVDQSGDTRPR